MLKRLHWLICTLLYLQTLQAQDLNELFPNCFIGAQPDWVENIEKFNDSSSAKNGEQSHVLALEYQLNAETETIYVRCVKKLFTQAAVQSESVMNFDFDPAYQSIVLHQIVVHRGPDSLDQIGTCQMELIQQEQDMDHYVYNGMKTWLVFLQNIQPGDILEYRFSKRGSNPAFKGVFDEKIYIDHEEPIDHTRVHILSSPARNIYFHSKNIPHEATQASSPDYQLLKFELFDLPASGGEAMQPYWYLDIPFIQLSEYKSWGEVAKWGLEAFKPTQETSEEIRQLAAKWMDTIPNPENRILQALRFVQNEIRYLGFERGSLSHIPTDPSLVFSRKFGDCKDKTLLLKTLLALMDVESSPVLVHTFLKGHISDINPSTKNFNHVILQVKFENNLFYLDPTYAYQGGNGLKSMSCNEHERGLVLDSHTTDLVEFPDSPLEPQMIASRTFEVFNTKPEVRLITKVLYRDAEANRLRAYYKQTSSREIESSIHDYYAQKYGQLEMETPLVIQDDFENNEVLLEMTFKFANLWKTTEDSPVKTITIFPSTIQNLCQQNFSVMRKSPLQLEHPCHYIEDLTFINEECDWEIDAVDERLESDEIALRVKHSSQGKRMDLHYDILTKKDFVLPSALEAHRNFLQKIEDHIFITLTLPKELPMLGNISEELNILYQCIFLIVMAVNFFILIKNWVRKRKLKKVYLPNIN